jgi:hypothetical protein
MKAQETKMKSHKLDLQEIEPIVIWTTKWF